MRLKIFLDGPVFHVFHSINRWFFEQIPVRSFTVDLDSTVMTRYGKQEGSMVGYNPQKRGRRSHHPVIAFVADLRMIAHSWLRPGNTSSANGVKVFLSETMSILGKHRIGLLRADSGFFDGAFLDYVEQNELQAYSTNLTLPAAEIWRLYRGRADSENRIEELKYDFGLDSFCLDQFYATEAAFRSVMISYNVISLFRQAVLGVKIQPRLATIRFQCFAIGSWIGKKYRKNVLRVSLVHKRRPWFEGLFTKIDDFS